LAGRGGSHLGKAGQARTGQVEFVVFRRVEARQGRHVVVRFGEAWQVWSERGFAQIGKAGRVWLGT
jgi:hypothetical protein